jgi:uncharacterized protein (TIGR00369 family)
MSSFDISVRPMRLPGRYAELMGDLYQQLAVPRKTDCQPSLSLRRDASFTASFNQRWQCLQVDVERAGENLADEVAALINRHKPCVSYIDLAVDGNGVNLTIESLNGLGFFYAGLLPEFAGADILRLQRLSDAAAPDFQANLANEAAMMAFADSLGAVGAFMSLPEGAGGTTTIESKTNFLGAAPENSVVLGLTTPVKLGKKLSVWQTRIESEDGKLVALITQTQLVL